jgi:hypothetical protein
MPRPLINQPCKRWAWRNIGHSVKEPCRELAVRLFFRPCAGSKEKNYQIVTILCSVILPNWETNLDSRYSLMNKWAKANV